MDSLLCLIAGIISGFFMVTIFKPPIRQKAAIPIPGEPEVFKTKTGCVRVRAEQVSCSNAAVSLNVLVNK
jgi:hypothetical protein